MSNTTLTGATYDFDGAQQLVSCEAGYQPAEWTQWQRNHCAFVQSSR